MKKIDGCEVCGGSELQPSLDLGKHPMCDDLVPVGNPIRPTLFPISIVFCPICKTAHQSFQIPKHTLFPTNYHYRARHTADVLNGMQDLVERCEAYVENLSDIKVLDIGCNDGSLLSFFAEKGAKCFGIEPTDAAADAAKAGHIVINDFLTPEVAERFVAEQGSPDIITFTNVFAHIEDLPSVIRALLTLANPTTVLVIENHYLGAVLDRYQFDTFYHEHPRTYSLSSFVKIAASLGCKVVSAEFPKRYGGNIRVIMSFNNAHSENDLSIFEEQIRTEEGFGDRLNKMGRLIPRWREVKRAEISEAVAKHGPLHGKAFPGRAAILVKLLDLDETMIQAVYEKPGSMKIGNYIPGTRIPILSDDEFDARPSKNTPLLNLAWHIASEIHGYMRKRGYNGEIIDLFSTDEFDRLTP
ncbi:MAG: class I SAM-dependent methyltransferase [Hyphomicrobiaceae bacterium]